MYTGRGIMNHPDVVPIVFILDDWVVVSNIFDFHPYLGKMNPF